MGEPMECADPHSMGWYLQHFFYSSTHLSRRFICEGDREYALGRNVFGSYEPSYSMNKNTGFATSCSGKYEHAWIL
jgi:hypothetical protein